MDFVENEHLTRQAEIIPAESLGKDIVIIGAGAIGAGLGLGFLIKASKEAMNIETYTTQFKILLGSLEKATQRMAMLKKMASVSPFRLPQFVEASKNIQNFSAGMLDNQKTLKLLGDAAAGSGKDFEQISYWYR